MSLEPKFIFDGDCSFCRCWVSRLERSLSFPGKFEAYNEPEHFRLTGVNREQFETGVLLWDPKRGNFQGGAAVMALFEMSEKHQWLVDLYHSSKWIQKVIDGGYRFVSDHRPFFLKITLCRSYRSP